MKGYDLQGWFAPHYQRSASRAGGWSVEDVVSYLRRHNRTGRNGLMAETLMLSTRI